MINLPLSSAASSESGVDVYLYTDGSGHQDGYGGSGSLAIGPKHGIYETRMASFKGTSVERAEFEALLMGCQSILEALKYDNHNGYERLRANPLKIQWFSDRESLVLSVTRGEDGNPVQRRKASQDLWVRFGFYESLFEFKPVFVKRQTNHFHSIVDRFASDGRCLVKDYMELPDNETFRLIIEAAKNIDPCTTESSLSPDQSPAESPPSPGISSPITDTSVSHSPTQSERC